MKRIQKICNIVKNHLTEYYQIYHEIEKKYDLLMNTKLTDEIRGQSLKLIERIHSLRGEIAYKEEQLTDDTKIFIGDLDFTLTENMPKSLVAVFGSIEMSKYEDFSQLALFGSLYFNDTYRSMRFKKFPWYAHSIKLRHLQRAEQVVFPEYIRDSLILCSLDYVSFVHLPEYVGDTLSLHSMQDLKGLKLPKYVGGYLDLRRLKDTTGVIFPKHIGSLNIGGAAHPNMEDIPEIKESFIFDNDYISEINGKGGFAERFKEKYPNNNIKIEHAWPDGGFDPYMYSY